MKKILFVSMISGFALASCTTVNKSMREQDTRLNLTSSDFKLSDQVSAEAKTTTIFMIDFERLFTKKMGSSGGTLSAASIPVIGNFIGDRTQSYAVYNLMEANPGYDVVMYPQYETKVLKPILGLGFLTKITTVKTTARLGKLK
jgi:hypothetical protein